ASNGLPWGRSEYEFAGYVKGAPLEVIRGPRTGLPLPANAELVIEGEVPPPQIEQRDEGPFGEFTGYYSGAARPRPVIRVHAFYRVLVVVDDDVDPSKPDDVLWAIATRSDPAASFEIQPECPSSPLDPMLSPEMRARGDMTTSRAVIIACRPWLWRDAFPVV